ncbi:MAG: hypothetical protein ACOC3V_04335 [bacterium]
MAVYRNRKIDNTRLSTGTYKDGNSKHQDMYRSDGYQPGENYQLNNNKMTIEQLIDYVQADLTFSGLMPKVLPDLEIQRLVKEKALQWFYKNYQWAVIKSYYKLDRNFINSEYYTNYGYLILPEECENVVKIYNIDNPSLFRIGVQAPNLSINFGVTNQPYLTSFVTNVGELGVYRQILSAFSDEINKMARNYTKFSFNPISKRLHILDEVRSNMMLDVYVKIEQEEVFHNQLFKDYIVGLSRVRMGEALGRFNFNMPGNFQYNAADIISQGNELITKTEEKVKETSPNSSFFIMKR